MRKRIIGILTLIIMAVTTTFGQIVYTQEDQGTHLRQTEDVGTFGVMVPLQNVNYDQWKLQTVPLGDGVLLLLGLGGAYLLGKRKKKQ